MAVINDYFSTFSARPEYALFFSTQEMSQSIPNNTTTLYWELRIMVQAAHGGSNVGSGAGWGVNVDGQVWSGTTGYNMTGIPLWGYVVIASGTRVIQHDANGYASYLIEAFLSGGPIGAAQIGPGPAVSPPRIPRPPLAPTLSPLTAPSSTQIGLAWSLPDARGGTISSYRIQYADNAAFTGATTINTGNATRTRTISGLLPGRTYWVRVAAQNQAGVGAYSAAQSIAVGIGGRRWTGSVETPFTAAKRWTGSAEVDITIAKRWNGTAEVDIT